MIDIRINNLPHRLPSGASLADAIALIGAVPPFAAAVNQNFVPRSAYADHALAGGDKIEVIRPVTGG